MLDVAELPTEVIVALFGLIGTLVGVLVTLYVKRRVELPVTMINEYQEMVKDLKNDVGGLQGRIAALEMKQDAYRTYVWLLREHISLDKGPPPPEWPLNLP